MLHQRTLNYGNRDEFNDQFSVCCQVCDISYETCLVELFHYVLTSCQISFIFMFPIVVKLKTRLKFSYGLSVSVSYIFEINFHDFVSNVRTLHYCRIQPTSYDLHTGVGAVQKQNVPSCTDTQCHYVNAKFLEILSKVNTHTHTVADDMLMC
jgi:hypothetical protein